MNLARLLLDPRGQVTQAAFLVSTIALATVKIAGDFAVAGVMFHRSWDLREYLFPHLALLSDNSPETWRFDAALLIWATPFAWMGLCLLAKRLRSAGAPVSLVILFFVPIAKIFLFAILCVLPERSRASTDEEIPPRSRKWAPESPFASALLAVACSTAIGVLLTVLATQQMLVYFNWLFLGLPFLMGFLAGWIHGLARPRRLGQSLLAAYLSLAITGVVLLSVAIEGIICLAMAAPIAICEATAGAWIAHLLMSSRNRGTGTPAVIATCLTLPLLIAMEQQSSIAVTEFAVETEISIAARPAVVWRHVVSFQELPPPHEWIFRLGVAYPQRAEIDGSGVGALRHCVFSTGAFVEPITVWNEPHQLAFDVIAQPDPLSELSPYRNLRPPHLHGYFASHRGEFRLIETNNGTLLRGTTWYSNRMQPEAYWKLWSDALIHRIHLRVLRQIRTEAEAEMSRAHFDSTLQAEDCLLTKR